MPSCRPRSASIRGQRARSRTRCRPSSGRATPTGRRRPARDQVGERGALRNRERGLPAINAVVVLNDAVDGRPARDPRRRPDHGACGRRPCRASAIRHFAPAVVGRAVRAAIIGAGVQGHSHLEVLGRVLPGVELTIFDRHPDRAEALAEAARATDGIGRRDRADRCARGDPRRRRRRDGRLVHRSRARQVMTGLARPGRAGGPGRLRHDVRGVGRARGERCSSSTIATSSSPIRDAGQFDGYPDPALDPRRGDPATGRRDRRRAGSS